MRGGKKRRETGGRSEPPGGGLHEARCVLVLRTWQDFKTDSDKP